MPAPTPPSRVAQRNSINGSNPLPGRCPRPFFELIRLRQTNSTSSPACLDGSPPVYFLRNGEGADARKLFVALQGGGWCESPQKCDAWKQRSSKRIDGATCQHAPHDANAAYEGAEGILSPRASTSRFYGWAVAYFYYCDGGMFLGTQAKPGQGAHGPQYYRGAFNLKAALHDVVRRVRPTELVLGGCSAGGIAALSHCERVSALMSKHGVSVRCIVDAALFPAVTFDAVIDLMVARASLPRACVDAEQSNWRRCVHGRYSLLHSSTPTFVINSVFNWRSNAAPSAYRDLMLRSLSPALNASSAHGAFASSCDVHCEGSRHWRQVRINRLTMRHAVERWYFDGSVEKHLDPNPAPNGNPDCLQTFATKLQHLESSVTNWVEDRVARLG